MDSGVEELYQALNRLHDTLKNGGDSWYSGLHTSYNTCNNSISCLFQNANNTLSGGWETCGDLFREIDLEVKRLTENLHSVVCTYVENVKENERKEKQALEKHHDSAESILDELGL